RITNPIGFQIGIFEALMMQSLAVTAVATIFMRTSSWAGSGVSTLPSSRTSGGPYRVQMTALTHCPWRKNAECKSLQFANWGTALTLSLDKTLATSAAE